MRRGLAGLVAACSLAAALSAVGGTVPAIATPEERARMIEWVNDARKAHGVKPLRQSWELWRVARHHSLDMADDGDLYHSTNLSQKLSFANWSTYGENVGVGVKARDLYQAFMRSDGHRKNILNGRFDKVGIAFARDDDGILWVTMIFYG
jgi:uncharacterized protein YkwD